MEKKEGIKIVKSLESLQLYMEHEERNKNSIWINHKFNHLQPSPYTSRKLSRNLPRYTGDTITQHHDHDNRLSKLLIKVSGIPLALLYGFIFTIILKYMILNKLPGQIHIASPPSRYKSNFSCDHNTTNITTTTTVDQHITQLHARAQPLTQSQTDETSPSSSPGENGKNLLF